jgi:rsbT antagonist protein RsbS
MEKKLGEKFDSPSVPLTFIRGFLVVPIQVELYDDTILKLQEDILEAVKEKSIKSVIIDFSAVDIIDQFLAQKIKDTAHMVALMGAETILTGFKPEVVASLVDMNFDFEGIPTALDQDDAFMKLEPPSNEILEEAEEELIGEKKEIKKLISEDDDGDNTRDVDVNGGNLGGT